MPQTRDHVPPKKIFKSSDRSWPLILPAHEKCNSELSMSDEQAKELVAALHSGPVSTPPTRTRPVGVVKRLGEPTGGLLQGLPLGQIIARILRGCHAALYRDYLPLDTENMILTPLPKFDSKTGEIAEETFLPQHELFCNQLKNNRKIQNVDRIHAYNGNFRFEAVWLTADGVTNVAAFGIDIYNWHKLGDEVLGRSQGCVGSYRIKGNIVPKGASVATQLELPFRYHEPLNPFEEIDLE